MTANSRATALARPDGCRVSAAKVQTTTPATTSIGRDSQLHFPEFQHKDGNIRLNIEERGIFPNERFQPSDKGSLS
ncbi:MAG: hypothetical protein QNJ69_00345 [Gammaproteobacteria bacterium]|nr:hypothetical protein [Gammaproteobacteria bacterium]